MNRTELGSRIKQAAYMEGDFTLRGDTKSKYYLDKYMFETQPEILRAVSQAFVGYIDADTTMIAGAELGGVPLATALSLVSGLPFVIIRNAKKDYGTKKTLEGKLSTDGGLVFLVEDIVTTGGQILQAAEVIISKGVEIDTIVAVVDREEGARENIERAGFSFDSLFTKSDLGIR